MQLSLVLPCYNEEANIATTVEQCAKWLQSTGYDCELVVANDGSKDRSLEILNDLKTKMPNLLKIVNREKNGGYGMAVRDGCDAATKEWIAYMDSDGQFDPADIAKLIEHSNEFSFVTGRRAKRADSFLRNMFGKVLGGINVLVLHIWIRDVNCGMKLFKREVWKKVRPTHNVEKLFNTEMFLNLKRNGIPWQTVNVPHYPRRAGNPTGGSRLILQTFRELWELRRDSKKKV